MLSNKSYKFILALAFTGLMIAFVLIGLLLTKEDTRNEPASDSSLALKEPAPNFTLELLDGGTFQLSDHKGKPVLINFFASWCLPCKEEIPALEKVSHEYKEKGVVFLAIAVDDTEEKVRELITRLGFTFLIGLDDSRAVQEAFGLYGVPTTYFIDKEGITSYFHSGTVTEELLHHELDKLL